LLLSTYSDDELLSAIRQDDEKAFAELIKRYWKSVHAMAYARVRSLDVTQDIVQKLFISIWDKRATLSIRHLPSYLNTATKNRVLNYIDSQLTHRKHWDYYKQFISHQEDVTEHDVQVNELMEALECGMNELPEKSKKIFRLHQLEGVSISEIARSLNLSEKAIQYHLTQSTKRLRLHLKDYMFTICALCTFVF
jgi:RNA polymerase sigma-70 factor (ECF subfamily)